LRAGNDWSPRFAIYGDLGNILAATLPRLQDEVQQGLYDAILHVGDIAYDLHLDNARVGDEFMRQIEPIAAYVPYQVCPGNHEEAYNFSNYDNRFSMISTGDSQINNHFWSTNIGPAHIVSISTEFYYYPKYGTHQIENQYRWLERDLSEANKPENRAQRPWLIVMGHRPLYAQNHIDNLLRYGYSFAKGSKPEFGYEELLHKYGVDLTFWAHEHNYERLWPIYNDTVCNGTVDQPYNNPKAPVHIITGSAGSRERHTSFIATPHYSAFQNEEFGYTRMTIHNFTHIYLEQLSVERNGGQVIDKFYLIKEKHVSLPVLVLSASQNPLCDPKLTIDSAFVDKYSDSGEDIITLFAKQTVHQLTVSSHENSDTFRYNSSQPLTEWSNGDPIEGPINSANHYSIGNTLILENDIRKMRWDLKVHSKTVRRNKTFSNTPFKVYVLMTVPIDSTHMNVYVLTTKDHQSFEMATTQYRTNGWPVRRFFVVRINDTNSETLDHLRHTTAGFVYKDYMYLMSGYRICVTKVPTDIWSADCKPHTITKWLDIVCEDITVLVIVLVIITAVLSLVAVILVVAVVVTAYRRRKREKYMADISMTEVTSLNGPIGVDIADREAYILEYRETVHHMDTGYHNHLSQCFRRRMEGIEAFNQEVEHRQTTAGFLYSQYFYLMAGNRICWINKTTEVWSDDCLPQTIAKWLDIDCGYNEDTDETHKVEKESKPLVIAVILGLLVVCMIIAVIIGVLI
ncbi:unnamed protein product, partial [Oppiella nova]